MVTALMIPVEKVTIVGAGMDVVRLIFDEEADATAKDEVCVLVFLISPHKLLY
jgi:hypothetical protein